MLTVLNFLLVSNKEKLNKFFISNIMRLPAYLSAICKDKKNIPFKSVAEIHIIYKLPITRNSDNIAIVIALDCSISHEILVDDDIWHRLMCCEDIFMVKGYAYIIDTGKVYPMHRFIMNYEGPLFIDHINRIKNNNLKSNLRLATRQENSQNTSSMTNSSSKYVGVSLDIKSKSNKWIAQIRVNSTSIYIARFDNEENAAQARDLAAVRYFKEFASLNFPDKLLEYKANVEDLLYLAYITNLLPENTKYKNIIRLLDYPIPEPTVKHILYTPEESQDIRNAECIKKINEERIFEIEKEKKDKILRDERDAAKEKQDKILRDERAKEQQEYEDSYKIVCDKNKKICEAMNIEELLSTFDM